MHLIPGVRGGFLPGGGVWGIAAFPTNKESLNKTFPTVSSSIFLYLSSTILGFKYCRLAKPLREAQEPAKLAR